MINSHGKILLLRPVTKLATKDITASTKNTNNTVLPISIETPAKPVAPNKIATSANTKNKIAALNIKISFGFVVLLIK